jgi:DMSO/TMAO reductase YedYZ molybdopterin-dependent catalytic subunit
MALYSPHSDPKYQHAGAPDPPQVEDDVIVSSDTLRSERLPPGQHRTPKWPVLHATTVPVIEPDQWTLTVSGLVQRPLTWNLAEFRQLPRTRVFADFHCVTTWSRLGNLWEGVSLLHVMEQVGIEPAASFARVFAADGGWTTNLPLTHLLQSDVLLADTHDGLPLDADHGGPVRLVVPRLFAWKSAKWVTGIELTAENHPGYWEQAGYHNVGDPWSEQRYRDDSDWLASS